VKNKSRRRKPAALGRQKIGASAAGLKLLVAAVGEPKLFENGLPTSVRIAELAD
jgi:hypothetical protein